MADQTMGSSNDEGASDIRIWYLEPVAWLVAAPNSEGYKRRAVSIVEIPPALHHLTGENC
jgi:hypothetical protein